VCVFIEIRYIYIYSYRVTRTKVYINVYSPQIPTATHKDKLKTTQLINFLPHFGPAT